MLWMLLIRDVRRGLNLLSCLSTARKTWRLQPTFFLSLLSQSTAHWDIFHAPSPKTTCKACRYSSIRCWGKVNAVEDNLESYVNHLVTEKVVSHGESLVQVHFLSLELFFHAWSLSVIKPISISLWMYKIPNYENRKGQIVGMYIVQFGKNLPPILSFWFTLSGSNSILFDS